MNSNYILTLNDDDSGIKRIKSECWTTDGDAVDEYLFDPSLSVSAMIEQYQQFDDNTLVSTIIHDAKDKNKKNLRCVVCGGRAYGYNFDQISCESCKAFFRRNALRNLADLQCRFTGKCNISVENRRHCTYCRLKKCFTVGMRKEWIRTEEEKQLKRMQIEKNRRRPKTKKSLIQPLDLVRSPNDLMQLDQTERLRLNNINHCYDKYCGEPSVLKYVAPSHVLVLRLDEYFNRKISVVTDFVSYFKHLPEFPLLNMDDQVLLIKQNIRILLPLNYSLLRTFAHSTFGLTRIQTIGCMNNANLHQMFKSVSHYVFSLSIDPLIIKLLLVILFFTSNLLTSTAMVDFDSFQQPDNIRRIHAFYTELLWRYMVEKYGEQHAIYMFSKLVTTCLKAQIVFDEIDTIVRANADVDNLEPLMKSILQLN